MHLYMNVWGYIWQISMHQLFHGIVDSWYNHRMGIVRTAVPEPHSSSASWTPRGIAFMHGGHGGI